MSNNKEPKILILGNLPKDYNCKNYITISPSCFFGTDIEPTIENSNNQVLSINELQKLSSKSVIYYNFLVDKLGKKLNLKYNLNLSNRFWSIFFNSWLLSLIQVCLEKEKTILDLIEKYKNENVKVIILKDKNWNFYDSHDFFQNGISNSTFNEWLNSKIIEENIPLNWKVEYKELNNHEKKINYSASLLHRVYLKISNILSPGCSFIYGFTLIDRIFFSLLLYFKPRISKLDDVEMEKKEILWSFNFEKNILDKIDFEYFNKLNKVVLKNKEGKLRLISADDLFYNSDKIFKTALGVESGEILIGAQHGGHTYGSALITDFLNVVEINKCSQFITWGWTNSIPSQTVRLPSPYLSKFINKYNKGNDKIILVSTRMNLFFRRFESGPQPKQWIDFRKRKIELIESIRNSDNLFENLFYKPYFNETASLRDISILLNKFPNLKFIKENLHNEMINCKLLILDHPGTTLNIAMAANIPVLCTWDKEMFPFNKQANEQLRNLENHKIYFSDVSDLVIHLNKINFDVFSWWNSSEVQLARSEWVDVYANTFKSWRKKWINHIWEI